METKMIGSKIAVARKKINISQAQLAQRLFISAQAVGKWERGESMPDIITLNRLAEILGVDLNYFSESTQSVVTATTPVEPLSNQSAELSSGKQNPPAGSPALVGKAKKKIGWDMSCGNWMDADFSGLKNLHEKFSSSNMQRCKFNNSDLSGILLKGNNVDSSDFSGSNINSSHIRGSNLANNIFKDCSLKDTEFSGNNIESCDFTGANFKGTEFTKSFLSGCNFTGADFTGVVIKSGGFEKNSITGAVWNHTSIIDSQIADIIFEGDLEDCIFENCAFTRVTFQNSTLINTFFKNNKKLKRVRFIDCKTDRMTYEFLKQGNADLTGVSQTLGGAS